MEKILIATHNKNKVLEIKDILKDINVELLTLDDVNFSEDVIEDGTTYFENALKKASEIATKTGYITISDDSGLEIEALGGAPGIYSARYSGLGSEANIDLVLKELKGIKNRNAKFVASTVIYFPNGKYLASYGEVKGIIIDERRGDRGFGYDPIFYLEEYGLTMAEVDKSIKNKISHRAKALKELWRMYEDSNIK